MPNFSFVGQIAVSFRNHILYINMILMGIRTLMAYIYVTCANNDDKNKNTLTAVSKIYRSQR